MLPLQTDNFIYLYRNTNLIRSLTLCMRSDTWNTGDLFIMRSTHSENPGLTNIKNFAFIMLYKCYMKQLSQFD